MGFLQPIIPSVNPLTSTPLTRNFAVYDRDKQADNKDIKRQLFVPEYGTRVSFQYVDPYVNTSDYHYKLLSKNLNNTSVRFNLKYTNRTEKEANALLNLFEKVQDSNSGFLSFNQNKTTLESTLPFGSTNNTFSQAADFASGVDIAFPTGAIYRNMSDLLIENYDFRYHDSLFDINLNLLKDNYSYVFDWSGSTYLDTQNVKDNWASNQDYKKFDVVYYKEYATGDRFDEDGDPANGNFYTTVNRIEKFYYCNTDHTATGGQFTSPTGFGGGVWSQDFFFDIDDGINILTDRTTDITKLKNSFSNPAKMNANLGLIQDLKIQLKNRSDKETFAILHFAEKHENMRPFRFSLPQLYTKKKFFIIKDIGHTFVYKDCNTIDMTVSEIIKFDDNYNFNTFSHVQ